MLPLLLGVAGLGMVGFHFKDSLKGMGLPIFGAEDSKDSAEVQHQLVFEHTIENVRDPVKLRAMAQAFRLKGKTYQADVLEKRAGHASLPADVKNARKRAYKKAMQSLIPDAVRQIADAYEKEGCVGAARNLREYGSSLQAIHDRVNVTQ